MDHKTAQSLRTKRLQQSVKDDESNLRQILTHSHAIEHNARDHTTDIKKNDLDPGKIAELVKDINNARDTIRDIEEAAARIDIIFEKALATLNEKYMYQDACSQTSSDTATTVEPVQEDGLNKTSAPEIAVVSSDSPSIIAQTTDSVINLRSSRELGRKDTRSADSGIALSTGSIPSSFSLLPHDQQAFDDVDANAGDSAVAQAREENSPSNDLNRQTGSGGDVISVEDNTAMLPTEPSGNRVSADQSSTEHKTDSAVSADQARQATVHRGQAEHTMTASNQSPRSSQAFLQQIRQEDRDFLNKRGQSTRNQRSQSPVD